MATSRLRLQKMIALVNSAELRMRSRSAARFSGGSRPQATRLCVMVVAAVAGRDALHRALDGLAGALGGFLDGLRHGLAHARGGV
jgi:hypothetical protein